MQSEQLYAITYVLHTYTVFTDTIKDLTFAEMQEQVQKIAKLYADGGVQITITQSWK
jgi:hypothetical protein